MNDHRIYTSGEWTIYHDCPGLRNCMDHPKWRVVALPWFAFKYSIIRPGNKIAGHSNTHTTAINQATRRAARKEQP